MAPRRKAAAAAAAPPPPTASPANGATLDSQPTADSNVPYGAVLQPLSGLVLALSGNFDISDYSMLSLRQIIDDLGAFVKEFVTKDVTHVIATRHDVTYNKTKVANANSKGLPLIRASWLLECDKQQKLVEYDSHLWKNVIEAEDKLIQARSAYLQANAAQQAATDAKKRPIAVANPQSDDSADQQQPASKKTKAANGTNGGAKEAADAAVKSDEDEEMGDAEEQEEISDEQAVKEQIAEGQIIKKKDAVIPVDIHCPLTDNRVYICPDTGMIYDASLNQTNASHNNNKFYIVQLLLNPKTNKFSTWTRWGRVGESGASAVLGNGTLADAVKQFEKKFKDKSGLRWEDRANDPKPGKYAFIERSYEPDSDSESQDDEPADKDDAVVKKEEPEPECTLDDPVRKLMEMIFNQAFFQATMAELNYDANKMPLGKLSKATILRGFEQLKSLSALFDDPTLAQSTYSTSLASATEHLSNTYYSLIPHDFGRYRPPIIRDQRTLKREVELLESLSDMKIAADLMKADRKTDTVHHLDRKFQGLGLQEMTPLKRTTKEFKTLEKYLSGTVGSTHGYKYTVIDIFRIERDGERTRFRNSPFASVASDRRLLWHGSRCTNFGGILSQGLRIAPPEAPVSGYMFGKGIYLADMSSKSAGYCCSSMSNGEGLLLLCEAELGNPMQELTNAAYDAPETAKKAGAYSTKGQGTFAPPKWMDAGAVHKDLKGISMPDPSAKADNTNVAGAGLYYNEYICYDIEQVQLRYLFRVKM